MFTGLGSPTRTSWLVLKSAFSKSGWSREKAPHQTLMFPLLPSPTFNISISTGTTAVRLSPEGLGSRTKTSPRCTDNNALTVLVPNTTFAKSSDAASSITIVTDMTATIFLL